MLSTVRSIDMLFVGKFCTICSNIVVISFNRLACSGSHIFHDCDWLYLHCNFVIYPAGCPPDCLSLLFRCLRYLCLVHFHPLRVFGVVFFPLPRIVLLLFHDSRGSFFSETISLQDASEIVAGWLFLTAGLTFVLVLLWIKWPTSMLSVVSCCPV